MSGFLHALWRLIEEARRDNLAGESAKVAYFFFLSIWPLFLGIFAFTGFLGGDATFEWIMARFQEFLPQDATRFLARYVREITQQERPDMLSLAIILILWSGSNIFASLTEGLNTMYDIEEGRSWWKRRLMSLGLLVCASVLLTTGATAILAGSEIMAAMGLMEVYRFFRWPLAFGVIVALLWLVYYFLPNRDQRLSMRYVTMGAIVGAGLWMTATLGFRFYVANFGSYDQTYGLVGAVIVLLIWMYLTALTFLIGGELAVSLEQGVHRGASETSNSEPGETHG